MNLSLDDQLKLALACGYKGAWIFEDRMVRLPPPRKFENWRSFIPTAPDTLMRLMFELKINVEWYDRSVAQVGHDGVEYIPCTTPEQIADAIIECSLQVIKGSGDKDVT